MIPHRPDPRLHHPDTSQPQVQTSPIQATCTTHTPPMHQTMHHGPACPSTKTQIPWLATYRTWHYMILLLPFNRPEVRLKGNDTSTKTKGFNKRINLWWIRFLSSNQFFSLNLMLEFSKSFLKKSLFLHNIFQQMGLPSSGLNLEIIRFGTLSNLFIYAIVLWLVSNRLELT